MAAIFKDPKILFNSVTNMSSQSKIVKSMHEDIVDTKLVVGDKKMKFVNVPPPVVGANNKEVLEGEEN